MATGLFNLKQVNQAISQGAWSGYIAPKWVEYLVVAGGGSGGGNGGGGGAGGLLTGIVTVATGTSYTVTVGAGGTGGVYPTQANGNNSVFGSISATAGGKGGGDSASYPAGSGGSGGGSGYYASIGQGTSGQGNAGGAQNGLNAGGGGGGAGTVGLNGASTTIGGNGGAGIASAITGTVVTYAGGGGGWANTGGTGGVGGVGGGGSTGAYQGVAGSGGGNTGGGGAGSSGGSGTSGSGGSGIVVVRYPGNVQFFTGGTVNYNNGYIIHIFTSSGTLAPTTPTPYSTSYQISRSLRFNTPDSTYLNRTPASSGSLTTWTFSAWVKRSRLTGGGTTTSNSILGAINGAAGDIINFTGSYDTLQFYCYSGGFTGILDTTAVYRDVSAWYHIVAVWDTTNATSGDRMRLYVNGVRVTAFGTATYPSLNATSSSINVGSIAQNIGSYNNATERFFGGYMTEVNFIDGQALTPSSFGATSTTNGVWAPIQYTGTYGTNGFYLNFSDNSNTTAATLGKDYSGNGNNWTPNNFSVTAGAGNDSLVDSPTSYGTDTGVGGTVRGNYCTLNPLSIGGTLANGNLDYTGPTSYGIAPSTIGMTSGKWYFEMTATSVGVGCGVSLNSASLTQYLGQNTSGYGYFNDGLKYNNGSGASYGSAFTTGDVISVVFDADAGTLVFYKNGTSQGTAFTGLTSGPYFFTVSDGTSPEQRTCTANFGQRPFAYTAPSGYKALCTQNLPTPTIGATSNTLASSFFAPVLYTGNNGTQSITVGFQPDFLWIKARSSALNHNIWDSVRTRSKFLYSNLTNAEATSSAGVDLISFDTNGFTLGQDSSANSNSSGGVTYVAWNWKANGSGASNSAGSITSTVSANTTSGFSIATFTKSGTTNQTIGHGLGVAPSMIIVKALQSAGYNSWAVFHTSTGIGNYLELNTTAASTASSTIWNNTLPTSTVFSMGTAWTSTVSTIAYCFAEVAGYSKFGSYTGNGSSDGPFVYTGFRPAYLLVKRSDSTYDWWVFDNKRLGYNATSYRLAPDLSDAEYTTGPILDLTSNGFKIRDTSQGWNGSGGTIIFAAFAESPFKYSLAR